MDVTTVAVLDDYQGRAREYADWASLEPGVEVEFFREPISPDALALTLAEFDVLVLMRERTAFPRSVLEALPNLRLLVTTGMRNASVDVPTSGSAASRSAARAEPGARAHPASPARPRLRGRSSSPSASASPSKTGPSAAGTGSWACRSISPGRHWGWPGSATSARPWSGLPVHSAWTSRPGART